MGSVVELRRGFQRNSGRARPLLENSSLSSPED